MRREEHGGGAGDAFQLLPETPVLGADDVVLPVRHPDKALEAVRCRSLRALLVPALCQGQRLGHRNAALHLPADFAHLLLRAREAHSVWNADQGNSPTEEPFLSLQKLGGASPRDDGFRASAVGPLTAAPMLTMTQRVVKSLALPPNTAST